MAGYTKEFLIDAFESRYESLFLVQPIEKYEEFHKMCSDFYDKVGKEKFRSYASLDAEAIRVYKASKI